MRVAIFVHCFFPEHFYGTETYTLQLARHLQEMGHDPVVVSAVFQGEPVREGLVTDYNYEGVPVVCVDKNHLPHTRVKETYYQESLRDVYRDIVRRIAPDIIHVTHLINHTAVLLEVAAELKVPAVATATDFFGFCFNNKLEATDGSLCGGPTPSRVNCLSCYCLAAIAEHPVPVEKEERTGPSSWLSIPALIGWSVGSDYRRHLLATIAARGMYFATKMPGFARGPLAGLVSDVVRRPDILAACYSSYRAIIAPTNFLRQAYEANGLGQGFTNIKFGVDIARGPKASRAEGAPIVFGFVGQIAAHKGVDLLLDAFGRICKTEAQLRIYGAADPSSAYMRQLFGLAHGRQVTFEGTFGSERMAEVLAGIDVLVIPSRWYENSPLVLLYALATHTPVIVADVAGMTEFLDPEINGVAFARGNVDSLAAALRRFIDEPALAAKMSSQTNYERTSRDMVADVVRVYQRALEAV